MRSKRSIHKQEDKKECLRTTGRRDLKDPLAAHENGKLGSSLHFLPSKETWNHALICEYRESVYHCKRYGIYFLLLGGFEGYTSESL